MKFFKIFHPVIDPKALAVAQTQSEKNALVEEVIKDSQRERLENKLKSLNVQSRHSRFGGTFAVVNSQGKNIITKKLVKNVEDVTRDSVKNRHKLRGRKEKGQELYKVRLEFEIRKNKIFRIRRKLDS